MKSIEFVKQLEVMSQRYIDECLAHTKQHATGSGKVVEVQDRHIPTIDFFLNIWLDRNDAESIGRTTWYEWIKLEGDSEEDKVKANTIKRIKERFNSLARDIVANEGKGIFYAKNALNMHDKQHIENKQVDKFKFDS
jgi:hypothetical protein